MCNLLCLWFHGMKKVWSHWIKEKLAKTKLATTTLEVEGFNFDSCAERLRQCRDLSYGRAIHRELVAAGHKSNHYLATLLVQMYGRVGSLRDAEMVYEGMDAKTRDVSSGIAILRAYAYNGDICSARAVFDSLPQKPSFAWSLMLKAYARLGHMQDAEDLYLQMPKPDEFAGTIVMVAFSDLHNVESGKKTFDAMPKRDVVSWNALVAAYAGHGYLETAASVLSKLPMFGASAMNSMLQGYSQASMIPEAKMLFDSMRERSVISMTAMLAAYAQGGDYDNARNVFERMPQHDIVSCNAIVNACASCSQDLHELKNLFDQIHTKDVVSWTILLHAYARAGHITLAHSMLAKLPRFDSVSAAAVIEAYGKSGKLSEARSVLELLPERHLEPCTVLMEAYSRNGHPIEAVQLFRDLELDGSTEPDGAIFTTLISACSHGGLVRLGLDYFAAMAMDHSLAPSALHYSCVADMLGRAGLLQEVGELAEKMPFLPVESMWIALLNACKIHDDRRWGAVAAERASTLRPGECVPYVMIAGFPS